ncbi:MAG: NADPH-dependent F420 reductase [Anaerolineales bacterium]|nr:NADPH-dependent F420 reductase [Anaerolineales bacterium]
MSDKLILTLALVGGTGKLGPGLAMRWAQAGYRVIIGSRQAEKAQAVADELNEQLGIESILGLENSEAIERADIVVLTVKQDAHAATVRSLKEGLHGKIVVDTTARVDFRDPKPPEPPSAPRYAQDEIGPEARVVAAFQTVPAHRLKEAVDEPLDLDVLICSDDIDAAFEVVKLVEGAGLNGYYAGSLDNAIVVEGLTAILIAMNKHYDTKKASIRVTGVR